MSDRTFGLHAIVTNDIFLESAVARVDDIADLKGRVELFVILNHASKNLPFSISVFKNVVWSAGVISSSTESIYRCFIGS